MASRELSDKLCSLGCRLEEVANGDEDILEIAKELHILSNENYSPSAQWGEIRKKVSTSMQKFYQSSGQELPF